MVVATIRKIGEVTLRNPKIVRFASPMEVRMKAESNQWQGTMEVSGKILPLQSA